MSPGLALPRATRIPQIDRRRFDCLKLVEAYRTAAFDANPGSSRAFTGQKGQGLRFLFLLHSKTDDLNLNQFT